MSLQTDKWPYELQLIRQQHHPEPSIGTHPVLESHYFTILEDAFLALVDDVIPRLRPHSPVFKTHYGFPAFAVINDARREASLVHIGAAPLEGGPRQASPADIYLHVPMGIPKFARWTGIDLSGLDQPFPDLPCLPLTTYGQHAAGANGLQLLKQANGRSWPQDAAFRVQENCWHFSDHFPLEGVDASIPDQAYKSERHFYYGRFNHAMRHVLATSTHRWSGSINGPGSGTDHFMEELKLDDRSGDQRLLRIFVIKPDPGHKSRFQPRLMMRTYPAMADFEQKSGINLLPLKDPENMGDPYHIIGLYDEARKDFVPTAGYEHLRSQVGIAPVPVLSYQLDLQWLPAGDPSEDPAAKPITQQESFSNLPDAVKAMLSYDKEVFMKDQMTQAGQPVYLASANIREGDRPSICLSRFHVSDQNGPLPGDVYVKVSPDHLGMDNIKVLNELLDLSRDYDAGHFLLCRSRNEPALQARKIRRQYPAGSQKAPRSAGKGSSRSI